MEKQNLTSTTIKDMTKVGLEGVYCQKCPPRLVDTNSQTHAHTHTGPNCRIGFDSLYTVNHSEHNERTNER